jgi:hypothetical protein
MSHFAYLAYLVIAVVAILAEGAWMGILDRRLVRSILVTVPLFFAFDLIGVARGWFYTDPGLNIWVLPGGVSVEEVINLAFLTVFAVALSLGFRRWRRE